MIHIVNILLLYFVTIAAYRFILKEVGSPIFSLGMTTICMFGGCFLAMKMFYGF